MEHREPPRSLDAEGRSREPVAERLDPPLRRFPRLLPAPSTRRLNPRTLVLATLGGLLGLVLSIWGLVRLGQGGGGYVREQVDYKVSFDSISLTPSPPSFLRGAKEVFLERVRLAGRLPREFSILEIDLAELRTAFQRDPWVRAVGQLRKVRTHGKAGIVVPLTYREPVAVALFEHAPDQPLDSEGVLLKPLDLDLARAGPLVVLHGFDPPTRPQFGMRWNRGDSRTGESLVDPEVVAAARLAGFLHDKLRSTLTQNASLPQFYIHQKQGLWVQVGPHDLFWWSGTEPANDPSGLADEEKWELLRNQVVSQPTPRSGPTRFFVFRGRRLVEVERKN